MPPLAPVYYQDADERRPVWRFIARLDRILQARFDLKLRRFAGLSTQRPSLTEPQCVPLDDELWALDCPCGDDGQHFAVVYAIYGTYCVVLHAYHRGGEETEREAQAIARGLWVDCLRRLANGTPPPPLDSAVP
jgi:hypothetical protein